MILIVLNYTIKFLLLIFTKTVVPIKHHTIEINFKTKQKSNIHT